MDPTLFINNDINKESTVVIVSACRTPIGSFCGIFKNVPAHELGSSVIREAVRRAKVEPAEVSEVVMGQSLTAGQGQNPARQASLKAGLPVTTLAYGINMLCGSGLKAVQLGYQAIITGDATIVVAGGQESMTSAQHCANLRKGVKLGNANFVDSLLVDGLTDATIAMHMGDTAEALAQKYNVSRNRQDEFALLSQKKTNESMTNGYFKEEIVPVIVTNGKTAINVSIDEFPRRSTNIDELTLLKPVFKGCTGVPKRTVTAGNSSGINDGAAAVVLMSAAMCNTKQLTPLARIVAFGQSGLEPIEMGLGPIDSVTNVLKKAGWTLDDVDVFELNEAFAVQSILVIDKLGIPMDKINVSGGAIALGHPIGCSGARILVTLIHNLKRLQKSRGCAALCIGGGMGIAICIEMM